MMIYSPENKIYSFSDGLYAISNEIDDIQGLRLGDMQYSALMIYTPYCVMKYEIDHFSTVFALQVDVLFLLLLN